MGLTELWGDEGDVWRCIVLWSTCDQLLLVPIRMHTFSYVCTYLGACFRCCLVCFPPPAPPPARRRCCCCLAASVSISEGDSRVEKNDAMADVPRMAHIMTNPITQVPGEEVRVGEDVRADGVAEESCPSNRLIVPTMYTTGFVPSGTSSRYCFTSPVSRTA